MRSPRELTQTAGDAIARSNRRFVEGAARGQAREMAAVYTDDAEFLPPNAESLRGQAEIERFWHGGIEMGIRRLELETGKLELAGGLAYEIGRYTLCFDPVDGAAGTDVAAYVVVHRRQQDGCWRRAVEIFNWNAPLA